jgi:hypothetical protein
MRSASSSTTNSTRLQLGGLRLHVDAAEHDQAAQHRLLGVLGDVLGHLDRQLARGGQHQRTHRVARRRGARVLVLEHALQQRQREGGGLAGAGLRRPHDVAAVDDEGNRLGLDRRHRQVAAVGDGAQQLGVECEGVEARRFGGREFSGHAGIIPCGGDGDGRLGTCCQSRAHSESHPYVPR